MVLISLLTLTLLEIVLGIDNLVFISIVSERLPKQKAAFARKLGLALALITRIILLFAITWLMKLTEPLFAVMGTDFSGKDLILIVGGFFLVAKATSEIFHEVEDDVDKAQEVAGKKKGKFASVIFQIVMLDIVFSVDSVITAVGMVDDIRIMIAAVVISIIVMVLTVNKITSLLNTHPSLKVLALSFLLLIGVMLIADGFHQHVPRGYLYSALGFSIFVEFLKIKLLFRKTAKKIVD